MTYYPEYSRKYYREHKSEIIRKRREYRERCRSKLAEQNHKYHERYRVRSEETQRKEFLSRLPCGFVNREDVGEITGKSRIAAVRLLNALAREGVIEKQSGVCWYIPEVLS